MKAGRDPFDGADSKYRVIQVKLDLIKILEEECFLVFAQNLRAVSNFQITK